MKADKKQHQYFLTGPVKVLRTCFQGTDDMSQLLEIQNLGLEIPHFRKFRDKTWVSNGEEMCVQCV